MHVHADLSHILVQRAQRPCPNQYALRERREDGPITAHVLEYCADCGDTSATFFKSGVGALLQRPNTAVPQVLLRQLHTGARGLGHPLLPRAEM
jgi:hypothetical protein